MGEQAVDLSSQLGKRAWLHSVAHPACCLLWAVASPRVSTADDTGFSYDLKTYCKLAVPEEPKLGEPLRQGADCRLTCDPRTTVLLAGDPKQHCVPLPSGLLSAQCLRAVLISCPGLPKARVSDRLALLMLEVLWPKLKTRGLA